MVRYQSSLSLVSCPLTYLQSDSAESQGRPPSCRQLYRTTIDRPTSVRYNSRPSLSLRPPTSLARIPAHTAHSALVRFYSGGAMLTGHGRFCDGTTPACSRGLLHIFPYLAPNCLRASRTPFCQLAHTSLSTDRDDGVYQSFQ